MHRRFHALTLTELLVAIVLLSIIVLGLVNINFFGQFHVISSSRRAKIQNEASLVLEHMSKEISKAIGNEMVNGANSVVRINISPNDALIRIYIDASGNGQWEPDPGNNPPSNVDHWIAYRFDSTGAPKNQLRYCGLCWNDNCNFNQCIGGDEIISNRITGFTPGPKPVNASNQLNNNSVPVQIIACWDPDGTPNVCGSPDNPNVTMLNRIKMPSVSTN